MKCDKDFYNIAKEVGTKSVKQCIQFYYLWKKVCGDEYKRLRIVRRKREQDELYNLRSKAAQDQASQKDDKEGTPSPKPGSDLVRTLRHFSESFEFLVITVNYTRIRKFNLLQNVINVSSNSSIHNVLRWFKT